VPSGKAQSEPIKHPVLGPADAILDDRTRSRGNLFLGLACLALGPLGVWMGSGDFATGSSLLGFAYVGGGVVLFLYGLRMVINSFERLQHRAALIVGRDGFEIPGGDGPVGWEEVATISDPASPPGAPRIVRVQLDDPDDYITRHRLGLFSRRMLRVQQNDLFLGRDMAMPVADVQALMRRRLAEFARIKHDGTAEPDPGSIPDASRRHSAKRGRGRG
jgi:hypothetical protein